MPGPLAVPLLQWEAGPEHGAVVAVTTRRGGCSTFPYDTLNLGLHVGDDPEQVVINRSRAAASFGVALDSVVFACQVHGTGAALVGPEDRGRGTLTQGDAVPGADVLLTVSAGVTLAMLVADCVPLALVDPDAGVLAAVHAGWRGCAAGAVGHAVRAMTDQGADARRIRAFLGPAVHPDRYQVSDEVVRGLAGAVGPEGLATDVARPDGPGHWLVDLVAANRQQLEANGIRSEHITASGGTTSDEAFFSDRAQRPCGRFALLARLAD